MDSSCQDYFPLRCEHHRTVLIQSLTDFFIKKAYVNVTLVCKGEKLTAHQIVLASYSPVFDEILRDNNERHPIIVFNDVSKEEMMVLLEYMYKGIVNVPKIALPSLLKIAKHFKILGLESEMSMKNGTSELEDNVSRNLDVNREPFTSSTPSRDAIVKETDTSVYETASPVISIKRETHLSTELMNEPKSKVINPFARGRRSFEDSDSTFCEEDLAKPGPSKLEVLPPVANNYDSDIEIIDTNPVVVISETQPVVDNSPEWFRKTQPRFKRKVSGRDSGDISGNVPKKITKPTIQDSEEESAGEKEVRLNPLALTNKNSTRKLNPSTATEVNDTSIEYKQLKKKRYNRSCNAAENMELLKLPFQKLSSYCIMCCKFQKNCLTHIRKTHQLTPRKPVTCKVCSRMFYIKEFLKFHKCVPI